MPASPRRGTCSIAPGDSGNSFPNPHVLLVASGDASVGKSVVAALTALSAAERAAPVLFVDAREAGGSLHHLFGARPTNSRSMALNTPTSYRRWS